MNHKGSCSQPPNLLGTQSTSSLLETCLKQARNGVSQPMQLNAISDSNKQESMAFLTYKSYPISFILWQLTKD